MAKNGDLFDRAGGKRAATKDTTPPPTSRCWRGWSRSGGGPACMSAAPTSGPCTISWPRCSTTPWTRRWPATPTGSSSSRRGANRVTVRDNGRGIPIDPHPKFPDKSALEVIMTTLHSGGKFGSKAYETSGGLHGVGVSVVNALAAELMVEVARNRHADAQSYARAGPGPLAARRRPQPARHHGDLPSRPRDLRQAGLQFRPELLHRMARSKAYLFRGVEIRWRCDPALLEPGAPCRRGELPFPAGLAGLPEGPAQRPRARGRRAVHRRGRARHGGARVEWAIAWPIDEEAYSGWYCNTVPTPLGGTHEAGLRTALLKGLRAHAERIGFKRAAGVTADDVMGGGASLLSLFIAPAAVPGPDQGAAGLARGRPAGRGPS